VSVTVGLDETGGQPTGDRQPESIEFCPAQELARFPSNGRSTKCEAETQERRSRPGQTRCFQAACLPWAGPTGFIQPSVTDTAAFVREIFGG